MRSFASLRMTVACRWPLPALLAWGASWLVFAALRGADVAPVAALLVATALCAAFAWLGSTPWRRLFIGCGFPFSLAASGLAGVPAWAWLLPLGVLACLYPVHAWRDAPLFPTPAGALAGLAGRVGLAAGARILDAGCGLGAGMIELRKEFPQAAIDGLEWSWPLRLASAWRCRFARVRRGDIWQADWSPYALVYLFQRPESMARAAEKAGRELAGGAWLASLEFRVPGLEPDRMLEAGGGQTVYLYRAPFGRGGRRQG